MIKKPSFIERLSGAIGGNDDNYDDLFDMDDVQGHMDDEHPDYAMPQRDQMQQDPRMMAHNRMQQHNRGLSPTMAAPAPEHDNGWGQPQEEAEGELAVDVYQTDDAIVIKALVGGVAPQHIDISVTRDMVTIQGAREPDPSVPADSYYQQELYWGPFSRTIMLPEEVDVDEADANERHGILMVTLPKINKARQAKIKVKSK